MGFLFLGAGAVRFTHRLIRIARVPIHFARYPHDDAEEKKEPNRSHEERIILLPESYIEKRVNAEQSATDNEGAHAAAEEIAAIPGDQACRGNCRNRVRGGEVDELRRGKESEIEEAESGADHEILERVNFL